MLDKSKSLVFANFGQITAEDMRKLRRAVAESGGQFKVVKKRLLNVALKEKGIDYDVRQFDASVGTIFSENTIDVIGGPVYRFFATLGADQKSKDASDATLLGAYDLAGKQAIERDMFLAIGRLPSREVLLGQLFGTIAAPLQAFMYLLQQKAEQKSA